MMRYKVYLRNDINKNDDHIDDDDDHDDDKNKNQHYILQLIWQYINQSRSSTPSLPPSHSLTYLPIFFIDTVIRIVIRY